MEKRILGLEDRIKELESLKSLNLFGRAYNLIGNSNSDFLIKTKGLVKIQWGNKFIDLIKDGKINTDISFIYSQEGSKEGIYVIGDLIYLLTSNGSKINLVGETGNTYVSFIGELETTPEQKYTALTNIGFIYNDLNSIDSLLSGIIYVESEKKLYIIDNGLPLEFTTSFPNPFKDLFIIAKETSLNGALLIKGNGLSNSISFDSLDIYVDGNNSILNSKESYQFKISNLDILNISSSLAKFLTREVVCNAFKSINANSQSGFSLYMLNGKSILEVDKLVVRDSDEIINEFIFPLYWFSKTNIINSTDYNDDDSYTIELKYKNEYNLGDCLYVYSDETVVINDEDNYEEYSQKTLNKLNVISSDISSITVTTDTDISDLKNTTIFYIGTESEDNYVYSLNTNSLDISKTNGFDVLRIMASFGDLSKLEYKVRNNRIEEDFTGTYGIYGDDGLFLNAGYTSEYSLDILDDSSKFSSTEWVNDKLKRLLPIGSIIMFNGTDIPDGWAICDGNNGTPNLIDRFIKAGISAGNSGGSDSITIDIDNLPSHSHILQNIILGTSENGLTENVLISTEDSIDDEDILKTSEVGNGLPIYFEPKYYTLIFIMKISN